jgi:outer membrane protein insertion porin family
VGQWGVKWRGETSYGKEFGNTTALPPYKRFFGGGPNTVRGYKEGRLGPFDSLGNPYGGNVLVASQMELLVPIPEKFQGKSRASLFYDVGNVFSTDSTRFFGFDDQNNVVPEDFDFDLSSMKHSVGVAAEWLSPMGVFRFSYGIPLNDDDKDEIEKFQFSVGSAF